MNTLGCIIGAWFLLLASGCAIGFVLGMVRGLVSTAASKVLRFWDWHELGPAERGAREVDEGEVAGLLAELSRRAKIPTPRLYVIESPFANASAASRDYRHASVCVTMGLVRGLSRDELAGVLAHEVAHVVNRSMLVKTIAAALSAALALLPFVGPFLHFGIVRSLILFFIAPIGSFLIQLAILRADEYAADARGARLCGRPEALASALKILSKDEIEFGDPASHPTARAFLTVGKWLVGPRRDNPFAAYPRPSNRIAALERLSRKDMGAPVFGGR